MVSKSNRLKSVPVFIFQMGKVGSSSVFATLKAEGYDNSIQYHYMFKTVNELLARHGIPVAPFQHHSLHATQMFQTKKELGLEQKWFLISMMREPISRMVADYFENHAKYMPHLEQKVRDNSVNVGELVAEYKQNIDPLHKHELWFDYKFKGILDIDIFEYEFEPNKGYSIFNTEDFNVCLMKLEQMNECFPRAMKNLLGHEVDVLKERNVGASKFYAQVKKEFESLLSYSSEELDKIYSSRVIRYFYSAEEIDQFKKKWQD